MQSLTWKLLFSHPHRLIASLLNRLNRLLLLHITDGWRMVFILLRGWVLEWVFVFFWHAFRFIKIRGLEVKVGTTLTINWFRVVDITAYMRMFEYWLWFIRRNYIVVICYGLMRFSRTTIPIVNVGLIHRVKRFALFHLFLYLNSRFISHYHAKNSISSLLTFLMYKPKLYSFFYLFTFIVRIT